MTHPEEERMPRLNAGDQDARRGRILRAARRCFGQYGYQGATVRRLEEATGLSRGALFHHFGDKNSLFLELVRRDAEQLARLVEEKGIVEVMREVLADTAAGGARVCWWGTRVEVSKTAQTITHRRDTPYSLATSLFERPSATTGATPV
jgi:AcrR family transcriptional regulator